MVQKRISAVQKKEIKIIQDQVGESGDAQRDEVIKQDITDWVLFYHLINDGLRLARGLRFGGLTPIKPQAECKKIHFITKYVRSGITRHEFVDNWNFCPGKYVRQMDFVDSEAIFAFLRLRTERRIILDAKKGELKYLDAPKAVSEVKQEEPAPPMNIPQVKIEAGTPKPPKPQIGKSATAVALLVANIKKERVLPRSIERVMDSDVSVATWAHLDNFVQRFHGLLIGAFMVQKKKDNKSPDWKITKNTVFFGCQNRICKESASFVFLYEADKTEYEQFKEENKEVTGSFEASKVTKMKQAALKKLIPLIEKMKTISPNMKILLLAYKAFVRRNNFGDINPLIKPILA